MANIIIDGYNLLGLAHKNLEKARYDLIQRLREYSDIKGHDITVVFDGWKGGLASETHERRHGINVIYSRIGEKADQVIQKFLSAPTKSWIAVSSDREVYNFAEQRSIAAITKDEFEAKLDAAITFGYQGEVAEPWEKEDDEELQKPRKKGNPRRLSGKEKRRAEAMKIL